MNITNFKVPNSSIGNRIVLALLLLLVLLSTVFVHAQDGEIDPSDLAGYAPCVLTELGVRSQNGAAYVTGGGTVGFDPENNGGIMPPGFLNGVLSEQESGNNNNNNNSPTFEERMNNNPNRPAEDLKVLILVIDDFSAAHHTSIHGNVITHGDYVLEALTAAYHRMYNSHHVVVDTVDYAASDSTTLTDVTNSVQAKLSSINPNPYDIIVFNMSWVILGCTVLIDDVEYSVQEYYAQLNEEMENGYDFIQYLSDASDLERDQVTEELAANILAYIEVQRAEIDAFRTITRLDNVLPIAAAGNFGRDETAAPAAWEEVLAVSGSVANNPGSFGNSTCVRSAASPPCLLWHSSNYGQVTAPAAWHATIRDEYISGTSFATPLTSVLVAIAGSRGCDVFDLLNLPKDGNQYFARAVFDVCRP
jgi:hypothetical protein